MAGPPNPYGAGVDTGTVQQGGSPGNPAADQIINQGITETGGTIPPRGSRVPKQTPENFTERLMGLATTHPWMPHQTVATLAAIPASDQAVAKMAADLKQLYGSVDNAVKYVTDDPLLQKTPSLGLYLRSYLTNTIGPWPLEDGDLVHVQKNLQKMGYAHGLPTDGVWTTGWNSAYDQYASGLRAKELGGDQIGSIPLSGALGWLNDLLPRQAATAVGAYVTSIPGSFMQDLHTLAGSAGGTGYDITHPEVFTHNPVGRLTGSEAAGQNRAAAAAENLIPGSHVTPEGSYTAQGTRTQLMDAAQIVGDVLAAHGILRAGGAVAQAAGDTKWTGLDAAAAQKGPGTIAKTLFGQKGVYGDTGKPLLSRNATTNIPILRMSGPVADKIAGGDGYYYRARTLLRAPYAVPGVQVAGTAVGQVGLAGAKVRAIGTAESLIGGQTSPLSNSIDHFQAVNQFDDAVQNRLAFTAFGRHFRPGINTLAWVLYPQLGSPTTLSATVGRDLTDLNTNIQEAFGPRTGIGLGIERGVNSTKNGDQRISYQDLVEMAGGPNHFNQWASGKMFEHIAAHMAEDEWRRTPAEEQAFMVGPGRQFQDKAAAVNYFANQYLHRLEMGDGTDLIKGASQMATDNLPEKDQWGGHSGFSRAIAGEIDRSELTPRQWLQKYMVPYGDASRLMREVVKPRRNELSYDDSAGTPLGMVPNDYLFQDIAQNDVNDLEAKYRAAQTALTNDRDKTPAAQKWQNYQDAASAIRFYALDKLGIDGPAMPQSDTDFLQLLHQKADAQLARVFPRMRGMHMPPPDVAPRLVATRPAGQAKLDRFTETPVFTKVKPSVAMELVHETSSPNLHNWVNDRNLLSTRGGVVTIEYEPHDLRGAPENPQSNLDEAGMGGSSVYSEARGQQRYIAQADRPPGLHPHDAYDSVRSVEVKPGMLRAGSKEATAASLLQNRLEQAGFVKFDMGKGTVRWVRPDLVGGTIAASDEMRQALAQMDRLGMTPVVGKALGSGYYDSPLLDIGDAHLTRAKRWLENIGLSPENIPSSDASATWLMNFHRLMVDAVADGKLKLFPTHTTETVIAMLRDRKAIPVARSMASAVQQISPFGRHAYDLNLEEATKVLMSKSGMTRANAQQQIANEMAQAIENPSGLMHVTKGDIQRALGHPPDERNPSQYQTALEAEHQNVDGREMYDQQARDVIYNLIQKANAMQPARLVGWQKAESLTALGLSYMGKPIPGSVGRAIEYLPTRLVTMRNKARFTLSPEFQLRRVVKIGVKGMLDDVPFTWHPVRKLMRGGESAFRDRMEYLDKVAPWLKNPNYDEGTQYLFAEDPWGIYPGTRNYAAYFADHWKQMGKTDTEIRQLLIKDTTYGSKAFGEGRSALEKSMNFVFFPFSFDKTLYRNVGAYLLDHTAQRLILQAGLEAYNRYNQTDPNGEKLFSSNWFMDRAPLIKEATRLNAFQYGLGLGQFGGINAPLLNFFIPQSYASTSQGLSVLRGILPIMKQFQNLATEANQTWNISYRLGADQFKNIPTLQGFKTGPAKTEAEALQQIFFAQPVAETNTAAGTAAYQYRRKLQALFRGAVDFNAHHTNKITLSNNVSEYGPDFAGHVINSTLVNDLVHLKYPTFQIYDPATYYDKEAAAIEQYQLQMSGQGRHDVVAWVTFAQQVGKAIYNHTHGMDTATSAEYTKVLRNIAIEFAETIPGFLTFYNQNFKWQFGPLERVRQ